MNELENPLNYRNINKTDSGQKMNATNSIYQCTKCEGYVYKDSTECHCTIEIWKIKDLIDEYTKHYQKLENEAEEDGNRNLALYYHGQKTALTELKQKIGG